MTAYLYRLFDDAGEVVHVGVTRDLAGAIEGHERAQWPARFVTWQADPYPDFPTAVDALLPARNAKCVAP